MEPLLSNNGDRRSELTAQAVARAPLLKQLAARINLAGAVDWMAEFNALCTAFVCGDGRANRAAKVRMAMLAAGAEGGERMSLETVAKIIYVPVHVVEVETARLFSTIAQAASLQLLPPLQGFKRTLQDRVEPSAALCARVASEVLLIPVCPSLAAEVADMYDACGSAIAPSTQQTCSQPQMEAGRFA